MTCWLKGLKDITCDSYRYRQGSHMLLTVMLCVHIHPVPNAPVSPLEATGLLCADPVVEGLDAREEVLQALAVLRLLGRLWWV